MSDEEIFRKVIEKVIRNGFDIEELTFGLPYEISDNFIWLFDEESKKGDSSIGGISLFEIIFRHDFAKAFWGEENECWNLDENFLTQQCLPAWQYYLQQMVLEKNPIKYLAKFL
jgi:hypothetical protein